MPSPFPTSFSSLSFLPPSVIFSPPRILTLFPIHRAKPFAIRKLSFLHSLLRLYRGNYHPQTVLSESSPLSHSDVDCTTIVYVEPEPPPPNRDRHHHPLWHISINLQTVLDLNSYKQLDMITNFEFFNSKRKFDLFCNLFCNCPFALNPLPPLYLVASTCLSLLPTFT